MQRQERVFTRIRSTINNAYVEDPPTAAAATIFRMCTLANLPFAHPLLLWTLRFTSYLHQLTTSHGNKHLYILLYHFVLFGLKARSSHGGPAYNSSKIQCKQKDILGISAITGNQKFCLFHFTFKSTSFYYVGLYIHSLHNFYYCNQYYCNMEEGSN